MATPARISVAGARRRRADSIRMAATVANAPAKADRAVSHACIVVARPFAALPPSETIARAAPKAAPWETPRVNGEASGLRITFCITAPAIPREAPATTAATARGRRMFPMMWAVTPSALPASAARTSPGERG